MGWLILIGIVNGAIWGAIEVLDTGEDEDPSN